MAITKPKGNFLAKHTAAIHISNELTLVDRKIYNLLIKNAFPSLLKDETHGISIEALLKGLGHNKDYNNYSFIKESIKKLVDSSIRFNILGKDRKKKWESAISLLSSAHFSDGVVFYSFPKELSLNFARPNIYASLNLDYQKKLSSKFTISLWEYCTEQLDSLGLNQVRTSIISLDDLRALLGATEASYMAYKNLSKLVLKRSITEINSFTDLEVELHPIKESRKIIGVSFSINRKSLNPVGQLDLAIEPPSMIDLINHTIEEQAVYSRGKELGLKKEIIDSYLKEFNIQELNSTFDIVGAKIKASENINNVVGYIWKVLEKGPTQVVSSETLQDNFKQRELIISEENHINQNNGTVREFLLKCKEELGDATYRSWITHLSYLCHDETQVVFNVPSNFIKEWIDNNYKTTLLNIWTNLYPSTKKIIIQARRNQGK